MITTICIISALFLFVFAWDNLAVGFKQSEGVHLFMGFVCLILVVGQVVVVVIENMRT